MQYDPLDYSPHTLAADNALQAMRKLLLNREYDKAVVQSEKVIAEMRLAKAAITDIKERQR